MLKRGKNPHKLERVLSLLLEGVALPEAYRDHKLRGKYAHCRECRIEPDWLLIYRVLDDAIVFERTGTHSDLFKK